MDIVERVEKFGVSGASVNELVEEVKRLRNENKTLKEENTRLKWAATAHD